MLTTYIIASCSIGLSILAYYIFKTKPKLIVIHLTDCLYNNVVGSDKWYKELSDRIAANTVLNQHQKILICSRFMSMQLHNTHKLIDTTIWDSDTSTQIHIVFNSLYYVPNYSGYDAIIT
jgi:hypothetical protein